LLPRPFCRHYPPHLSHVTPSNRAHVLAAPPGPTIPTIAADPEGRDEIESAAEALSDLAERAHTFPGVATQAWLFLQAELNDPGGAAR
jgi:hypothetical protein